MLDGGDGVLGVIVSSSLRPNTAGRLDAKDQHFVTTSPSLKPSLNHSDVHCQTSDGSFMFILSRGPSGAAGFDP